MISGIIYGNGSSICGQSWFQEIEYFLMHLFQSKTKIWMKSYRKTTMMPKIWKEKGNSLFRKLSRGLLLR